MLRCTWPAPPPWRLHRTTANPGGREAVIACGAPLFNARIAVPRLGFRPAVDLLPEPGNSGYLAHVGHAAHAPATPEEALLALAMPHPHTHRGPFGPEPVPDTLLDELCDHARAEDADLRIIDEPEKLRLLADLVRTAEDVHRADPRHAAEIVRSVGPEGVPVEACRRHPDATLLAGRDHLEFARYRISPSRRWIGRTGTVAVLSTPYDSRTDWLRSGQARQRALLHAAAHKRRGCLPHPAPRTARAAGGDPETPRRRPIPAGGPAPRPYGCPYVAHVPPPDHRGAGR
ncbi:hypothetical protein SAMN04487981_105177 [Streptomyces sp. cf386]|nr:hypothetical protein SAMN04487981_105177 [Streptomyces sp. cf386]